MKEKLLSCLEHLDAMGAIGVRYPDDEILPIECAIEKELRSTDVKSELPLYEVIGFNIVRGNLVIQGVYSETSTKTSLYRTVEKSGNTQEIELCKRHKVAWENDPGTVSVTPIETRSVPLWWGDQADGEHCEWCAGDDERRGQAS